MEILVVIVLFALTHCIRLELTGCPANHFKVKGMRSCHPWIGCDDLDGIKVITRIGTGAVKDVFLVSWRGFAVVLSVPVNLSYLEDFIAGVNMLRLLNPSKHIVQFLGYCNKSNALLTEYHPEGNAADFFTKISPYSALQGLEFCYQYALILNYLHNGPAGKRVFCDSNSLDKLLSQLLVTPDKQLVLNDVDALPEVIDGVGIKCGHQQLQGVFVAPEQLWSRSDLFRDNLMHSYNEKTDIWKAATVCDYFLGKARDGDLIRYRLYELHSSCKLREPLSRPTAEQLVREYSKVAEEYRTHSEL